MEMDATAKETSREFAEMYEELTSPEKQKERMQKDKEKKIIQRNKNRLGL